MKKTKKYTNPPYGGHNGERSKADRKKIAQLENSVTYTPTKLGSHFILKNKPKTKSYILGILWKKEILLVGQTKCQIIKHTLKQYRKDNASYALVHSKETKHRKVSLKNVKILGQRYKSDFKQKISEYLFAVKTKQKDAFKPKLYNTLIGWPISHLFRRDDLFFEYFFVFLYSYLYF